MAPLSRRAFLKAAGSSLSLGPLAAPTFTGCAPDGRGEAARPHVLLFLTDDHSWLHVGAYGDPGVSTPAIDSVARDGVLFQHAYVASSSCVPSRSALLTGQHVWRLEQGAVFGGTLPRKFPVFPGLLGEAGYHVGWTGKGWGPGNLVGAGWGRRYPQGIPYNARRTADRANRLRVSKYDYAANFAAFLDDRPDGAPFAFWCGVLEPHEPYAGGSGLAAGKRLSDARLPGSVPDLPAIRSEVLDHYMEVEYLDAHLGRMLAELEARGLARDTLVVVTSDNGIALPRAKGNLYDTGTRVPLAVRWPGVVAPGRTVDDMVGLIDLAPTFLEAAGLPVPEQVSGRSLLPVLGDSGSGRIDPGRDAVFTALERHAYSRPGAATYPMRAIRTHRWLYVRNLEPDRWPAGDPEFEGPAHRSPAKDDVGYLELSDTQSKRAMLSLRASPRVAPLFHLTFDKRPPAELYDCEADPAQIVDLAGEPAHAATEATLRERLEELLRATGAPRPRGETPFDGYPFDVEYWPQSTYAAGR